MAKEIERKYLVRNDSWKKDIVYSLYCQQGYIYHDNGVVRVRIMNDQGCVAFKGINDGISRDEFEYSIPVSEAREILVTMFDGSTIRKTRYIVEYRGFKWEVDIFGGDNEGLIVAEIEIESEDIVPPIPDWVGEEVSHDSKYYNSNLINNPYNTWGVVDECI